MNNMFMTLAGNGRLEICIHVVHQWTKRQKGKEIHIAKKANIMAVPGAFDVLVLLSVSFAAFWLLTTRRSAEKHLVTSWILHAYDVVALLGLIICH